MTLIFLCTQGTVILFFSRLFCLDALHWYRRRFVLLQKHLDCGTEGPERCLCLYFPNIQGDETWLNKSQFQTKNERTHFSLIVVRLLDSVYKPESDVRDLLIKTREELLKGILVSHKTSEAFEMLMDEWYSIAEEAVVCHRHRCLTAQKLFRDPDE